MNQQKETMQNDDVVMRILIPEIYLSQLPSNGIGVPSCSDITKFENFMKQKEYLEEDDRINILKQVEHCLMRLHNQEYTCNESSHSQRFNMENFFTKSTLEKSSNNIQSLANLFCFILTNGEISDSEKVTEGDLKCSHPDVALDIIKKMTDKTVTKIEQVLQHPFHWSDQEKVIFIYRAFDYINARNKNFHNESYERKKEILSEYNMSDGSGVISKEGWIDPLVLTKKEVKEIQRQQQTKLQPQSKSTGQYDVKIDRELICNLAEQASKQPKEQREKSIFELLRFFRNRYAHFDEDSDNIKMVFGNYPAGYLKFFTSRFPKLFMHVYNSMKTYMCTEDNVGEFANQRLNPTLFNVNMYVASAKPGN